MLRQANKAISNNADDAKLQIVDAYAEFEALQTTMKEVGLGQPSSLAPIVNEANRIRSGYPDTLNVLVEAA